jgi:type IV secretion system protein VirD4
MYEPRATSEDIRPPEAPNDRPLILALGVMFLLAYECGAVGGLLRLSAGPAVPAAIAVPAEMRPSAAAIASGMAGAVLTALVYRRKGVAAFAYLCALLAWLAAMGGFYSPLRLIVWQVHVSERAPTLLLRDWATIAALMVWGSWLFLAAWRSQRGVPATASHGSARWGDPAVLEQPAGVLVGRHDRALLRLDGEGHVLTVAPTRSGKGVSCVIPNLLDHPGSALVTDPKGENYAVTAAWREKHGHVVQALDPFDLVQGCGAYNPLSLVDVSSIDAADDARMLADMLVLPEGKEGEQTFWNEEARGLLTGLILHAASSPESQCRTLPHVRALLTLPPDSFNELLTDMSKSDAAGGLVARAAARILQKADRERSGVISTAQSHTHFLDSRRMARVLSCSTFDFRALKTGRMTVYLVLPPDRLDSYARWLRLMIACGLLAVERTPGQPSPRILFLLDEFAHLRRMQPVQRDIGLAGGYGVRFWLVLQDLSQLRATYAESWPTFLANVDLLQAFGTSDWETAEYLSKMTGDSTIRVASENHSTGISRGRNAQRQQGSGWSMQEKGRRLLFPDEVRRLPRDRQLVFIKGTEPLLLDRINYLTDPAFAARAQPNPLYAAVAS